MPNHALLNNVDHADLRVITTRAARYGDDVMCALTFPAEFRNVQAEYPIFFHKDPQSGQFQAVAMFGFEDRENLFLDGDRWDASYVPLSIARQPFLIGRRGADSGAEGDDEALVHIDLDHPRVSRSEGERLFLDHGGTSPWLDRMSAMLHTLHLGFQGSTPFVEQLVKHDLLELFALDVELDDGSTRRLAGYYTINEEHLHDLDGSVLAELNQRGYLQAVFMAIASLSNIGALIRRRNAARGQGAEPGSSGTASS